MNFFIGPMSKNVIDVVLEFSKNNNIDIVFIPSRRQIDYNGGYVNNWNTQQFVEYVKKNSTKTLIERDHAGPGQGTLEDDGYDSLSEDSKLFDIIHIDPWKKYPNFNDGLKWTVDMIEFCYTINPNLEYEIATEESIRKFEVNELETLILELQKQLAPEKYQQIKYLVIQCGTKLSEKSNIGLFDVQKLSDMLQLASKYNLIAKEHNGDWVSDNIVDAKYACGLKCINIAPEFGEIETEVLLRNFKQFGLFEEFYRICYESKKWVKWVNSSFIPEANKEQLVLISGHYTFSYAEFIKIKDRLIYEYNIEIDDIIRKAIYNRLQNLYKNSIRGNT